MLFINICKDICTDICLSPYFEFFGYIPGRGLAGSYGNFMFNFLKNCQAVFHRGCTIFHSYQQCTKVPISSHPYQHCFFFFWPHHAAAPALEVQSLSHWTAREVTFFSFPTLVIFLFVFVF